MKLKLNELKCNKYDSDHIKLLFIGKTHDLYRCLTCGLELFIKHRSKN